MTDSWLKSNVFYFLSVYFAHPDTKKEAEASKAESNMLGRYVLQDVAQFSSITFNNSSVDDTFILYKLVH